MYQRINFGYNWVRLLSMRCLNNYYTDGRGNDFEFIPTNKTQILMKNYGIVFKRELNGFSLFCDPKLFQKVVDVRKGRNQKLIFLIKNTNNYLINYTDLSFSENNKTYYFTNLKTAETQEGRAIHENDYVHESQALRIYNKYQSIKLDKFTKSTKIVDARQKSLNQELWLQEVEGNYLVRLQNFAEGQYSLIDGKRTESFYVIDYIKEPMWGILDLFLDNLPTDSDFFSKGKLKYKEFIINLSARKTFWKYFILPENKNIELKLEEVKVSYNGKAISFTKPKKVTLNNGMQAFAIETTEAMELKELTNVADKLEMKLKNNSKWLSKSVKIPKPKVKSVKPDKETNKIYSTTYIYL